MTPRKSALVWRLVLPVAIAILPLIARRAERRPDAGRHPQGGELPDAATGAGRRRPRAALPERHALERQPRQEVVPRRDRRRSGRHEDLLQAVPRAGRPVHRLQGEPRPSAHGAQQHRHPDHLRRRRLEEDGPAAGRRARLERRLVARQQERRVLRPRRGRDAHLDRGRRHRAVAPGDEDAGARHARQQLRLHEGRQADRRRPRPRHPHRDAAGAGVAAGTERQARARHRQEPPPHVPEPDVDAVPGAAPRMAHDRTARARSTWRAAPSSASARRR